MIHRVENRVHFHPKNLLREGKTNRTLTEEIHKVLAEKVHKIILYEEVRRILDEEIHRTLDDEIHRTRIVINRTRKNVIVPRLVRAVIVQIKRRAETYLIVIVLIHVNVMVVPPLLLQLWSVNVKNAIVIHVRIKLEKLFRLQMLYCVLVKFVFARNAKLNRNVIAKV